MFKDLIGYEGFYQADENGRIKALERIVNSRFGPYHKIKEHFVNPTINSRGYLLFTPSVKRNKKNYPVHIAVWEAFNGPVPNGYDVHHINNNRTDNRLENLQLLTKEEHQKLHGKDKVEIMRKLGKDGAKSVVQYTLDNKFIAEYKSIKDASLATGINSSNISACCRNKLYTKNGYSWVTKTAGGYVWKYKEAA